MKETKIQYRLRKYWVAYWWEKAKDLGFPGILIPSIVVGVLFWVIFANCPQYMPIVVLGILTFGLLLGFLCGGIFFYLNIPKEYRRDIQMLVLFTVICAYLIIWVATISPLAFLIILVLLLLAVIGSFILYLVFRQGLQRSGDSIF